MAAQPRLIIIGGGVSGIELGAKLKTKLNYHNFTIYERHPELGGTWFVNNYPGVGCDVDSHLYSFSFNPNPDWSKRFAEKEEILQYLHDTSDKFGVTPHMIFRIEVTTSKWVGDHWEVHLKDLATGYEYMEECDMLISAVGAFGEPSECRIPGVNKFQGKIIHTARWDMSYDWTNRTIGVIGNGCSAAQAVPKLGEKAKMVYQFQRSPQWINERPNPEFTPFQKWCFRYIPLWNKLYRFNLFYTTDAMHYLYLATEKARKGRAVVREGAIDYMKRSSPKKYHDILIPKFDIGCKRRLFDPGYLAALHWPNIELTADPITEIYETGIRTAQRDYEVDEIVLATGFKTQEFLCPMEVIGKDGKSLNQHWKETRGAQAYKGTFVSGFPNMAIIFGPNSFPSHMSVIFATERQCEYIIKSMIAPIIQGSFKTIEVKRSMELYDANFAQEKLKNMVWSEGCSNWNLNEYGRNTTNFYENSMTYMKIMFAPVWADFDFGGLKALPAGPWKKLVAGTSTVGAVAAVSVGVAMGYIKPASVLASVSALATGKA
ncbi:uncharacterized protein V1510DRAFT_292765 [Dipodascopsis tothii]|uniref:uncharacterized protein n=1 Tax=Dipodascopsis tothii TaxID=44089 RepID=UPI0034CFDAB9